MEEFLKQIVNQLNSLENRFGSLENRFDSLDNRMGSLEEGQKALIADQNEMRKEVGFYYGSMMKKLDETKTELSSEIKQVSTIQKQHQSVLDYLNEKQ
ncbi:hypothetical protein [Niallia sp. 01092]|uniref:hypothetical protein n=1 Tax=unclassified Niallia TaxID=2837522 RepID=UPI003FD3426C